MTHLKLGKKLGLALLVVWLALLAVVPSIAQEPGVVRKFPPKVPGVGRLPLLEEVRGILEDWSKGDPLRLELPMGGVALKQQAFPEWWAGDFWVVYIFVTDAHWGWCGERIGSRWHRNMYIKRHSWDSNSEALLNFHFGRRGDCLFVWESRHDRNFEICRPRISNLRWNFAYRLYYDLGLSWGWAWWLAFWLAIIALWFMWFPLIW